MTQHQGWTRSWSDEMAEFLRSGAIVLMGTIVIGAGVFVIFYG
ncbi:MAG: hypothetical protein AB7U75_09690 [Hyphomicrobiaceae bacterium]